MVTAQAADRLCARGILIRLVTGASRVDIERSLTTRCPTPPCARRDEWADASVFEQLASRSAR